MFEISEVEEGDLDECAKVRADARQHLPSTVASEKIKESQNLDKKIKSCLSVFELVKAGKRLFFKYSVDDKILGVIIFHLDVPELGAIYVDPFAQHAGIGTALFTYLLTEIDKRDISNFFLWTPKNNPVSRSFYEKMGCRCSGEIDELTRNGSTLYTIKYTYEKSS